MIKRIIKAIAQRMSVLQKQLLLGMLIGAGATGGISMGLKQITKNPSIVKQETKEEQEAKNEHVGVIESPGQKLDGEGIWRYKMKEENDRIKGDIDYIKKILTKGISGKQGNNNLSSLSDPEVDNLRAEIERLKMQMGGIAMGEAGKGAAGEREMIAEAVAPQIRKVKIKLSASSPDTLIKYRENTIAAGSFAKAVLLGGVDASTALSSSSDPRPLLIRLTDPGTLPRRFQSDLRDCHIVASGYGDLSSERVFARLEKLTCVERGSGEIIETEVAGYVAGEDGRAGIKGTVIEKGRGYLAKSVLGGVLQGVAGVFNPDRGATVNSVGAFFPKRNESEKFKEGMMSGASGSMDRLSKYYIDRAESIQPVIQIASGRIVDVVFTEGADIGSHRVKEQLKIQQNRNREITKEIANINGVENEW